MQKFILLYLILPASCLTANAQMPKLANPPPTRRHTDCKEFAIAHQGIKDSSLLLRKNEQLVLPVDFPPPLEGATSCGCMTNLHSVYYITDSKPETIFKYYMDKLIPLRYTFQSVIKSDYGKAMMMRYTGKNGSGYIYIYLDKAAYSITYQPVSHECHCKNPLPRQ